MFNKKLFIVLLSLILAMSLSAVSAENSSDIGSISTDSANSISTDDLEMGESISTDLGMENSISDSKFLVYIKNINNGNVATVNGNISYDEVSVYSENSGNLYDFYVNGSGSDVNTQNNNYLSINGAISNTVSGVNNNIYLSEGLYNSSSTCGVDLSGVNVNNESKNFNNNILNKNISIIGQGADKTIISADLLGNLFYIGENSTLNLINLSLINGNSSLGGAIYNNGSLNIFNSILENNTAAQGACIYSNYYEVDSGVENTIFRNNHAYDEDNLSKAGVLYLNEGLFNFNNCSFVNNSAEIGGAIYVIGNSFADIDNSTMINNSAILDNNLTDETCKGGFIYSNTDIGGIDIANSVLENNSAFEGGAIFINGSENAILNNNFIGNTAEIGGAIFNCANLTLVSNSSFNLNRANTGDSIYNGYSSANCSSIDVYNCKFLDNVSDTNDEGIFDLYNDGNAYLYGNEFSSEASVIDNGNITNGLLTDLTLSKEYSDLDFYVYGELMNIHLGYLSHIGLSNENIIFKLTNILNQSVSYTLTTDETGFAYMSIKLVPGNYTVSLLYAGNGENIPMTLVNNFSVTTTAPHFEGNNVSMVYGDNGSFVVKLTDGNFIYPNMEVKLNLTNALTRESKVYTKTTDENGTITLPLGLYAGTYNINCIFEGDKWTNATSESFNVFIAENSNKSASIMHANDLEKSFNVSANFTTVLTDINGSALAGKECQLILRNIYGETKLYWRTTNTEGVAKLAINLIPGTWYIDCFYSGDKLYKASNISEGLVLVNSI